MMAGGLVTLEKVKVLRYGVRRSHCVARAVARPAHLHRLDSSVATAR